MNTESGIEVGKLNNLDVQDLLDYQPGRKRESHAKKRGDWDWDDSNTNQIDFKKVDKFLAKHAKKTQRYIEATFERVTQQT